MIKNKMMHYFLGQMHLKPKLFRPLLICFCVITCPIWFYQISLKNSLFYGLCSSVDRGSQPKPTQRIYTKTSKRINSSCDPTPSVHFQTGCFYCRCYQLALFADIRYHLSQMILGTTIGFKRCESDLWAYPVIGLKNSLWNGQIIYRTRSLWHWRQSSLAKPMTFDSSA